MIYSLFEARSKDIQVKVQQKEHQIQLLRQRYTMNKDAISTPSDQHLTVWKRMSTLDSKQSKWVSYWRE
jgi:hypothetical protein